MGSGETKKQILLEIRKKLYASKQETNYKENLRKRKARWEAEEKKKNIQETKEEFEIRKNAQEDKWIDEYNNQDKPFDETWFPDYWLVFCYMGKPSGKQDPSFNTTPINAKGSAEVGIMIQQNVAKQGRTSRRNASIMAAAINNNDNFRSSLDSNIVPNKNSIASSNNDVRFVLATDPLELKLRATEIRIEQRKLKQNQLTEKLEEINHLEAFVERISRQDPHKFKKAIEETQRKIDILIMKLPSYIQVDQEPDDEFENTLTIENLAKQNSYIAQGDQVITPLNDSRELNQNNSSSNMQKSLSVVGQEPLSRIQTRGKKTNLHIEKYDDDDPVEYEDEEDGAYEEEEEVEEEVEEEEEEEDDDDDVEIEEEPLPFVSKSNRAKASKVPAQLKPTVPAQLKPTVPAQLKPLAERFTVNKTNSKKRHLPPRPKLNLPKWTGWESGNGKLHGIFGYTDKYDGIISQEAKTELVNTLYDQYGVVLDNVLPFFDELLEKIKIDMEKTEDEKFLWERWVRCIDNVTSQI
jgi:hypothetical protein